MAHSHLLIRANVRKPLLTLRGAKSFVALCVDVAQMRVISGPHAVMGKVPGNEGVTAMAILDFSHCVLHEWPYADPYPLIHFDLYSCGPALRDTMLDGLFAPLDPVNFSARVIDRDSFLSLIDTV